MVHYTFRIVSHNNESYFEFVVEEDDQLFAYIVIVMVHYFSGFAGCKSSRGVGSVFIRVCRLIVLLYEITEFSKKEKEKRAVAQKK